MGSYDFDISQYEKSGISEDAYMTMMASRLGVISGSFLTDLDINSYTIDIRLMFSEKASIVNFNNSCGVEDCWKVVDGLNKKKYIASPGGVMIKSFDFNKYRRAIRKEEEGGKR